MEDISATRLLSPNLCVKIVTQKMVVFGGKTLVGISHEGEAFMLD